MPFDFTGKLVDLAVSGLGAVATVAIPKHWKKRVAARFGDRNPLSVISTNHDLKRAIRIGWIEATLEVLDAARELASTPEWSGPEPSILDFEKLARAELIAIRDTAFDCRIAIGESTIDAHARAIMIGASELNNDADQAASVTTGFAATLGAAVKWPPQEVPEIFQALADQGLPTLGGGPPRAFGELVFAAFAELIKDPEKYPEAREAFHIAMNDMARCLGETILAEVRGLDSHIDAAIARLDPLGVLQAGAARYLETLPRIAADVAEIRDRQIAHDEKLDRILAEIARKKDVPASSLRAVLAKIGETGVADEDIPARLDKASDELNALRTQLGRLQNDRPELAAIRARALALIDAGEFDQAKAELNRGRFEARKLREDASRNEAEFLAEQARIDHLQLAYRAAAERYGEAAALVASFDSERLWSYQLNQADELGQHGDEFGENDALVAAIEIYKRAANCILREIRPLDWAGTENNLGNALSRLGEREVGTARLEEAVTTYREALKERTRDRVPLEWAATQNNLGNALTTLGAREASTARLQEAVAAYREALKEYTQDRVPLDWAMTQNNLGTALGSLSEHEVGTARLEEAVAAFREALKECTRDRVPREWAMTQNNLGNALSALGEREAGTARVEEAVAAYREALKEFTRDRVPLNWAATQTNLGTALLTLGEREVGTARLEEAVAAYREALKERTRDRVPLGWAATQNSLGMTLQALGEREAGTARLEEAVSAYREALAEYTQDCVPLDWAMTQHNLGNALSVLGEREAGTARLEEAVAAYREALKERTRDRVPRDWARTQKNLDTALNRLNERKCGSGSNSSKL